MRDARTARHWPARVYIGVGTKETPDDAMNAEGQAESIVFRTLIAHSAPATAVHLEIAEGQRTVRRRGANACGSRRSLCSERRAHGGRENRRAVRRFSYGTNSASLVHCLTIAGSHDVLSQT